RVFRDFLKRLRDVRVLEPACGSGNFLYLTLRALKDLEKEVRLWGPRRSSRPWSCQRWGLRSSVASS
ncbi:MAG TPA: DNA methyltransferase, partial [Myxococcaceae bacterium]